MKTLSRIQKELDINTDGKENNDDNSNIKKKKAANTKLFWIVYTNMCLGAQPFLTNKNIFSVGVMAVSSKLAIARMQT